MNKSIIVAVCAFFGAVCLADEVLPKLSAEELQKMTPAERTAYREKKVMRTHGGLINVKGTPAGQILIVNAQKKVSTDNFDIMKQKSLPRLAGVVKHVDGGPVTPLTASAAKEKSKADFVIFLVDDKALPPSLVAVEARWAIMNVAALEKGAATPEVVRIRARNEFARVFAMLCGAFCSQFKSPIMNYIKDVNDLDNCLSELPVDVASRTFSYLDSCGVKPERKVPYSRAVRDGWAPAPTNEFQKAVWKRMTDEKERGPVNALKIVPPKK